MGSVYFGIYVKYLNKIKPKVWKELVNANKSDIIINNQRISSTKGNVYDLFHNGIPLVTGASGNSKGRNPIAIKILQAQIPEPINLALVLPIEYKGDDTPPPPLKCYCNDIKTGEQIEYPCDDELPERCKGKSRPVVFDFVVETNKNFVFDQADLTQEAKDKIDSEIVDKWNKIPQNRKEGYLEFLKDKTINVNAYASIDALSNFPDGGRYAGCSNYGVGKGPRVKYNLCLSQARAESVVEYLKTIADGAFKDVNFVAVGKGETNQFSGLKWDNEAKPKIVNGVPVNVKSRYGTDETKSDRRFEVKFPKWHTETED
jgi:outer membrane protein OmpA-like peptidoglycan-associated protein